ncbi:MAG: type II toxin-antitoxin system VapC family toxin [Chromatiales bacterium]|nr:type II toxin-antitoxin system VapC family toxin [Chromatiales bacterium]
MRVYFDSSAFAKRYLDEAGTREVLAWSDRAQEVALSVVAIPELVSAFCRLRRDGVINESEYQQMKGDFMADIADALICDTSPQVIQQAVGGLESNPLRTLDAIHVAAALAVGADTFVSADARQCAAARGLGMNVVAVGA